MAIYKMKIAATLYYFFLLLLNCCVFLNIQSVFAEKYQSKFESLPSIDEINIGEYAENNDRIVKPTEYWNKTADNKYSIVVLKDWDLATQCRATYPIEWVTSGPIDAVFSPAIREFWREVNGNKTHHQDYFVSRYRQIMLKTGWARCRSVENHTFAVEIFMFVKDSALEAAVFVNSSEYYVNPDPKIIPCAITNPNLTVSLTKNGEEVFDAKYDPRIGFQLHGTTEIGAPNFFQCQVKLFEKEYAFRYHQNDLTALLVEPQESQVAAFDNNTLKFICKSNKEIKLKLPTSKDENLHISWNIENDGDTIILVRGNKGQTGEVSCESGDKLKTWQFTFYEKPGLKYRPSLNDFICETNGTSGANFTWIHCKNRNTCELNQKCLDNGKCSSVLNFAKGDALSSKQIRLGQPPLGGRLQCSIHGAKEIKDIFRGLDNIHYMDVDEAHRNNALLDVDVRSTTVDQDLYSDKEVYIVCRCLRYLLITEFQFEVVSSNGERKILAKDNFRQDFGSEEIKKARKSKPGVIINAIFVNLTAGAKEIVCKSVMPHSVQWYHASKKINVEQPEAPVVKISKSSLILTLGGESQLICEVTGSPRPNVTWKTDATGFYNVTTGAKYGVVSLTIIFSKVLKIHEGKYICEASNRLGVSQKTLHVTTQELKSLTQPQFYGIIFGSSIAILLLAGILLFLWIHYNRTLRLLRDLTDEEIEHFIKGSPDLIKDFVDVHENAEYLPYNTDYEIPIKHLSMNRNDVLGSGAFGVVVKGTYKNGPVAVKTTKPNADVSYFKALLSELKIMIYIGHHPNIVSFIGSFTENIKSRILYIIVEYCSGGNLHAYLQKYEKELKGSDTEDNSATSGPLYTNTITSQIIGGKKEEFLLRAAKWSKNIADGMEFLENKRVIHGDLACRNILLSSDNVAKVTDFGLSRQLYEYSNYTKKTTAALPWRWMAIESLAKLEFSSKSDVWSYGVTIWEVYSLGHIPFPGQNWTQDLVEMIQKGSRMKKPKYGSSEIYEVMGQCWSLAPEKRPSFRDISVFFRQIVDDFHADEK